MASTTGATPLFAIEAVAVDTETTGLDAAKVRIIQLGAIHIANGALDAERFYEQLIAPGVPIPPPSTAIHGITENAVLEAPTLKEAWPTFIAFLDERVVVGHSIGFDLTVLAAEAERNRLAWKKPRSLCVRLLATIVAPTLANHSLDALASWLGLETRNRHQALGDAEAAGLVFLALIPKLREKGIRTLAEAERACLGLLPELNRHANAGWDMPVSEPGLDDKRGVLDRFDSYAYRHRTGDLMASPVTVVTPDTTLKQALDLMASRAISSVFVSPTGQPNRDVRDYAILTERDAMRRIAKNGAAALDEVVAAIGSRPIHTIHENAFLYRAIGRMSRLKIRHLGVHSDSDILTGVVSARDLLRLRADPAIALNDVIEESASAETLAVAWSSLPGVVNALIAEEIDARVICEIVSEEIRAMTRRAAVLAAESMISDGKGDAPCPYAVMVLGSGGRGESLLVPDQDNAIVFATGAPGGTEDRWFAELGARMTDILDAGGIPYCTGGVMARNDAWRGSVDTWKDRIDGWVRRSTLEDALNVDIFFDLTPVHGARSLALDLLAHAYDRGRGNVAFAKALARNLSAVPEPFTMLGGLKAAGGRFDLKLYALFPIVAATRTLAIRHNVRRQSTKARIEELIKLGLGSEADFTAMLHTHTLALSLMLGQQSQDIASGRKSSNLIDLNGLSRSQKNHLKQSLKSISHIPTIVRDLLFKQVSRG
ncbi:MAG: CBS domain-containing protein [Alphaproteobacteria bacterium]|nr:CBS domain-containing protein [Alphaproteobacteria bacterium]